MKLMTIKKTKKLNSDKYSVFIDKEYIELQTGQEFSSQQEAKEYFFELGWKEGVDPCTVFSVSYYLSVNPDVAEAGINPLHHYVGFGDKEGRNPHFLFDLAYYCSKSEVDGLTALEHYIVSNTKCSPSPYFNEGYYKEINNLAYSECGLDHFIKSGGSGETHPLLSTLIILPQAISDRDYAPYNYFEYKGCALFDPKYYKESYPGVEAHGLLNHYVTFGKYEGRLTANHVYASLAEKITCYDKRLYDTAIEYLMYLVKSDKNEKSIDAKFSVVIVNWNKSNMTVQCVAQLLANTTESFEIVIVDNGSRDEEYRTLIALRSIPNLKIIRLDVNRYFGEANNIGVEETNSELVCFLNNDAFVTKEWEIPLLDSIQSKGYSASSPKFLFPDGRLQEAGGQINSCGQNVQFGKGLDQNDEQFNFEMDVDHASAACLLMCKRKFAELGGFDLRYEPAYYEDADLSAKLKASGGCIRYKPNSIVYHVENATSKDPTIGFDFNGLIATNRLKFVEKWGQFLRGGQTVSVPDNADFILNSERRSLPKSDDKIAVVFSPYNLVPGGGERYILSYTEALTENHITYFCSPSRYSYFRLATMGNELGVDVSNIRLIAYADLNKLPHIDTFVVMSNELSPSVKAQGREKNTYHCQFPFPMSDWHIANCLENVEGYDEVIVNSNFTKNNYERQASELSVSIPPVKVLSPPVKLNENTIHKNWDSDVIDIVNVGRYIAGGHCKKQYELIEAFKELVEKSNSEGLSKNFRMSFVGSLSSSEEDRAYFAKLKAASEGFNIRFYINASLDQLNELYRDAHFYWHGTGINESVERNPEVFEHFGITPIEAMGYGLIPVVWKDGGPAEVLEGSCKYIANEVGDYAKRTLDNFGKINISVDLNKYSCAEFRKQILL